MTDAEQAPTPLEVTMSEVDALRAERNNLKVTVIMAKMRDLQRELEGVRGEIRAHTQEMSETYGIDVRLYEPGEDGKLRRVAKGSPE